MNGATEKIRWFVIEGQQAVARTVVGMISEAAASAIGQRDAFSLVLAGGSTPKVAYAQLAETTQQWEKWSLYYGDERCLPPGDPERNSHMVIETGLAHRAGRHFPIPAERGPQQGAAEYAPLVDAARPFDMVLLGMGEDGHTASLFPGHPLDDAQASVIPVHDAPKPPPDRISLTATALQDSTEIIVIVTGKEKADALRRWLDGEALPIAQVTAGAIGRVSVVTDQREVLETFSI